MILTEDDMPIPATPGVSAGSDSKAQAAAIVAGTLCLMSCYVQHPAAIHAGRVADNLHRLTQLGALSPELRTICRRLVQRWDMICRDAQARAVTGEQPIDARALH